MLVTGRGAVLGRLGISTGSESKPGSIPACAAAKEGRTADRMYIRRPVRRPFNLISIVIGQSELWVANAFLRELRR
jgi:hypothetical protein